MLLRPFEIIVDIAPIRYYLPVYAWAGRKLRGSTCAGASPVTAEVTGFAGFAGTGGAEGCVLGAKNLVAIAGELRVSTTPTSQVRTSLGDSPYDKHLLWGKVSFEHTVQGRIYRTFATPQSFEPVDASTAGP